MCAGLASAYADNAGKPMTFEWGTVYGDTQAIFADGDFTTDTPQALRAFLEAQRLYPRHGDLSQLAGRRPRGRRWKSARSFARPTSTPASPRTRAMPTRPTPSTLDAYQPRLPGLLRPPPAPSLSSARVSRDVRKGSTLRHPPGEDGARGQGQGARPASGWVALPNVTYRPDLARGAVAGAGRERRGCRIRPLDGRGPDLPVEMVKADANSVNPLTEDQLNAYRINFTMRTESWSYDTGRAGPVFPAVQAGR